MFVNYILTTKQIEIAGTWNKYIYVYLLALGARGRIIRQLNN